MLTGEQYCITSHYKWKKKAEVDIFFLARLLAESIQNGEKKIPIFVFSSENFQFSSYEGLKLKYLPPLLDDKMRRQIPVQVSTVHDRSQSIDALRHFH